MIDMIRTFHPMGQGGFISEKFIRNGNVSAVVYDCGSQSGKSLVEREIRNCFEEHTEIKAVYISHLDNDHVNGLEFLIRHCRVEKVFLPYLAPESLFMAMVKYKCEEESGQNDLCSEFVLDLIYYSYERFPEQFNSFEKMNNQETFPDIHFVYPHGINIRKIEAENIGVWEYLTFNNENAGIRRRFFELLKSHGISENFTRDINSFWCLWNNLTNRNILKEIYKQLDGGINANSLGVVSYPLTHARKDYICRDILKCKAYVPDCYGTTSKAGAVYVGDMDLSDLNSSFYKYRNEGRNIGLLELAHHGSINNYHPQCTENIDVFVACAGCSNPYGHPSGLVIDDLTVKRKELRVVTEHPATRYREHIIIDY